MQRPAPVDTYLLLCFYEGISTPRRLAEGLQRLGELLACQRVSLRLWDRRGDWGCLTQAARAAQESGGWQLSIEDGEPPEAVLRALVARFEPGQWKRLERLSSALPGDAGVVADKQAVFSARLPLSQADALLSVHWQGGDPSDKSVALTLASDACRYLLPALDPMVRLKQLSRQCVYLTALLNGIRMPMLLLDVALRPLATNASARTMFRLSARMPTGRVIASLPGVAASEFAQGVQRACSDQPTGGVIGFSAPGESGIAHLLILPVTLPASLPALLPGGAARIPFRIPFRGITCEQRAATRSAVTGADTASTLRSGTAPAAARVSPDACRSSPRAAHPRWPVARPRGSDVAGQRVDCSHTAVIGLEEDRCTAAVRSGPAVGAAAVPEPRQKFRPKCVTDVLIRLPFLSAAPSFT